MRLVNFVTPSRTEPRLGVVLASGAVGDLGAAAKAAGATLPGDIEALIAAGDAALHRARDAFRGIEERLAAGERLSEPLVWSAEAASLLAPLTRPGKFIAAGKNFRDHMAEMKGAANLPARPVAFPQMQDCIVGPETEIPIPPETEALDYEVEVAIVIGRPALRISAQEAWDYIFGFTVFNDLSARDVYRAEGATGIPLMGKNLPGFAPLGPCLLTRDAIGKPEGMAITLRVNGETRQSATLAGMLFPIPELIAHWSAIGLEPGDIVTTGTPSGVAAGRKPDQTPWWLKPGDLVEAEVTGIGILRNRIVAAGAGPHRR